jgi:hypothetical protein
MARIAAGSPAMTVRVELLNGTGVSNLATVLSGGTVLATLDNVAVTEDAKSILPTLAMTSVPVADLLIRVTRLT